MVVEAVPYRYRACTPLARPSGTVRPLEERALALHPVAKRCLEVGFQHLAEDVDKDYATTDSTIVCAHQHSRLLSINSCARVGHRFPAVE